MKFFFPDSQDQIDPSFDFDLETRSEMRVRQRDDLYSHEVFKAPPYDGLLVSISMVDLEAQGTTRYTLSQRHRFQRLGVRRFFRIDRPHLNHLETMGDCGAFNYVREEEPPYTVEYVADFYERCGFDYGVSVDHIILAFHSKNKQSTLPGVDEVPEEYVRRREITLELAKDFLHLHRSAGFRFKPIGVAQGWSAESYADSVNQLQKMCYERIGMGGFVPLKTTEIIETLEAVSEVRKSNTQLHLFGISRFEPANKFKSFGVSSLDSKSPFRQAFKSATDNYYTQDGNLVAVRVPQVDGNTTLRRRIQAGEVNQEDARRLERLAMDALVSYSSGDMSLPKVLDAIDEYDLLIGNKSQRESYEETLALRPWEKCDCDSCREIGIHAVIFRGTEGNKLRGFHNLHVFYKQLGEELANGVSNDEH